MDATKRKLQSTDLLQPEKLEEKVCCRVCPPTSVKMYSAKELLVHQQACHRVSCSCCLSDFIVNERSLCCKEGHHICDACLVNCITYQLKIKKVPLQCPLCSLPLPTALVDALLNDDQRRIHDVDCLCKNLGRDEIFFPCQNVPCCSASLVAVKKCTVNQEAHTTLIPCLGCSHLSCIVCLGTVLTTNKMSLQRQLSNHRTECTPLLQIKLEFEQAVRDGATARCPRCGIGGHKESGCNSIYCEHCCVTWCYVCECTSCSAQYHLQVQHISNNLEKLHRYKTCKLLNDVYNKYGAALFNALWTRCEAVRAHGFSKNEIIQVEQLLRPTLF